MIHATGTPPAIAAHSTADTTVTLQKAFEKTPKMYVAYPDGATVVCPLMVKSVIGTTVNLRLYNYSDTNVYGGNSMWMNVIGFYE